MHEVTLTRDDFGSLSAAVLRRGDSLRFRARGHSMRPFIHDGDVLLVRPGLETRPGDVVLCRARDGRLLAHRVARVVRQFHPHWIVLQGDACPGPDGVVPLDSVLGRVISAARGTQIIRLDAGLYRWLGWLWIRAWPLRWRIHRAWGVLAQAKGGSDG